MKKILIILFCFFFFSDVFAQAKIENKSFDIYLGTGKTYGGSGLNFRFTKNHIGVYLASGYKGTQQIDTIINLPSSFNIGLGGAYYFAKPTQTLRPKLGVHLGWLSNYYDDRIGDRTFRPSVYGAAFILGFEMGEKLFYFDFNFIIDPGFAIINKASHPYYSDRVYISVAVGLGLNLYDFQRLIIKKKERKPRTPKLEPQDYVALSAAIDTSCNPSGAMGKQVKSGAWGKVVAYKQIDVSNFIVISVNADSSSVFPYGNYFTLDSLQDIVHVYMVEASDISDSICYYLKNRRIAGLARFGVTQTYEADVGAGSFIIRKRADNTLVFSAEIRDLKLENKDEDALEEIYYDEIIICNIIY